jgi:hypothetical protein
MKCLHYYLLLAKNGSAFSRRDSYGEENVHILLPLLRDGVCFFFFEKQVKRRLQTFQRSDMTDENDMSQ